MFVLPCTTIFFSMKLIQSFSFSKNEYLYWNEFGCTTMCLYYFLLKSRFWNGNKFYHFSKKESLKWNLPVSAEIVLPCAAIIQKIVYLNPGFGMKISFICEPEVSFSFFKKGKFKLKFAPFLLKCNLLVPPCEARKLYIKTLKLFFSKNYYCC